MRGERAGSWSLLQNREREDWLRQSGMRGTLRQRRLVAFSDSQITSSPEEEIRWGLPLLRLTR